MRDRMRKRREGDIEMREWNETVLLLKRDRRIEIINLFVIEKY